MPETSSNKAMEVHTHLTKEFERMAKPLAKKYKSFKADYNAFIDDLEKNPMQGTSLGGGVRLDISLLSIYDKGEIDNVSDAYIHQIVSQVVE